MPMNFINGDTDHVEPKTPQEKEFYGEKRNKRTRNRNEMLSKDIVKNSILLNKVREYFERYPKRNSVVIRAGSGEDRVFWKAVREAKGFRITEVNTCVSSFVLEINSDRKGAALNPNGSMPLSDMTPVHHPLEEASSQFQDISKAFIDAVSGPPNPAKMANSLKLMNVKAASIQDPGEKQRADNMIANLSALSTASRVKTKLAPKPAGMAQPTGQPQEARKRYLREASEQFISVSHDFVNAMTPPFNYDRVATAFRKASMALKAAQDPKEKEQLEMMVHVLAKTADETNKARHMNPMRNASQKRESRLHEASSQFGQASQQFVAAMTPPFDHAKLSTTLKKLNQLIGQITDPAEKSQMGMMIGELTNMVDKTTAGGGSKINTVPGGQGGGVAGGNIAGGGPITQGFKYHGKQMQEAEKKKTRRKRRI